MKLAVYGYGRFGRALVELAKGRGDFVEVVAWDPTGASTGPSVTSPATLVAGATHVVLAVPVPATADALAALVPHLDRSRVELVMDVGSVKVRPVSALAAALGDRVPWVGTHPLFGPASLALAERPLRVVVCPNARHPAAASRARAFYEKLGCEVVEATPEEHDRLMARTHALAFFVAKGVLDVQTALGASGPPAFAPASYQGLARTIDAVRSDAGHLFRVIEQENPFAAEARHALLDALVHADDALSKPSMTSIPVARRAPGAGGAAPPSAPETAEEDADLAIPDLGELSPTLRETRAHIDAVDREIVALVARRSELSRRAREAKQALGHGVVDTAREAELLAARRAWAASAGLDADSVEDLFHAILRHSRAVQQKD